VKSSVKGENDIQGKTANTHILIDELPEDTIRSSSPYEEQDDDHDT
jgi:hypothetical protein